jgi:YHS domain-containing protein/uncharacterized membrane protein YhaH (DUF805 family)
MHKKWWIVIAVVVAVAVLMSLLFIPFELGVIREVYSYVVNEVVSVTGLSQVLVKGVVIILLLPLLWVIPVVIKRRHKFNKFAWAGVLMYVAVFFLSISYFSQNINFRHDQKETLKWYALTPEGVKYFDTPGIDPVYGIVLKPLTSDIIGRLKLLEKGDIKLIDPENFNLFNSITGEPQAWYFCSESNVYEFYDKPGFHPQSGSPLLPVTKDVYEAWMKSKSASKTAINAVKYPVDTVKASLSKKKRTLHRRGKSNVINDQLW